MKTTKTLSESSDYPKAGAYSLNKKLNAPVPKAPPVDPNKCFNLELLELVRKNTPSIESDLEGFPIELLCDEPILVWVEEIHGLEAIRSNVTGEILPRGFQTRNNVDLNSDAVKDITEDIRAKKWDPSLRQGIVFSLEETEYEGASFSSRGVERKWGIANLHHRLQSAIDAGEDYIIVWPTRIKDIGLLRKWACAVANRASYANTPVTDLDIVGSIKADMETEGHDLPKRIDAAKEKDRRDIIAAEVKTYNVRGRKIDKIVRLCEQQGVLQVERRRHDMQSLNANVLEYYPDVTKAKKGSDNFDFESTKYVVKTAINQGAYPTTTMTAWCKHVESGDKRPFVNIFANDNSPNANITKENRDEERKSFERNFLKVFDTVGRVWYKVRITKEISLPTFLAALEFGDEMDKINPNDPTTWFIDTDFI